VPGNPLSSGTVAALTARAAGRLDGFLERVRESVAASPVAGIDETGFRVEGRLAWVHCARTGKYTLLMVHPRCGKQAMEAMGVLPAFAGVAVHDAWAPYDLYTGAGHQLCCAPALRELQAVTDSAPAGQWCWATQAAEALTGMQTLAAEAVARGRDAADPAALAALAHRYRSAVLPGHARPRPRSGKLAEQSAEAVDLVAQLTELPGQGGEVRVRGCPLLLTGRLLGKQVPDLTSERSGDCLATRVRPLAITCHGRPGTPDLHRRRFLLPMRIVLSYLTH
jgi:transposase